MKTPLFLIYFTFFTTFVYSQWIWQTPKPQGNDLHAISFADTNIGYAVGAEGTLLKTIDAGATWNILYGVEPSKWIFDVDFIDASTGYIVGEFGSIQKTTDGGDTWTTIYTNVLFHLYSVDFYDDNNGFAVGGTSYVSTILYTHDGGNTWIEYPNSINNILRSVFCVDANTAYVVGSNKIYKTIDGGVSWTAPNLAIDSYDNLFAVFFTDADTGYAVGENQGCSQTGRILKTTDAGSTWNAMSSGVSARLLSVFFTDADNGYITGTFGTVMKTNNAGATWSSQTLGSNFIFKSIFFSDANNGFIVGSCGIMYKTNNAGTNWHESSSSATFQTLDAITFTNNNIGYAVGNSNHAAIIKTVDAGLNWVNLNIAGTKSLNDICFIDSLRGFVCGYQQIMKTTDAGLNWSLCAISTTSLLQSLYFINQDTGYSVGSGGAIYKTQNSGDTWSLIATIPTAYLYDVAFTDANHGFVVGPCGMYSTINGGDDWFKVMNGPPSNLFSIYFTDADTGYAVGEGTPKIIKTTDGGVTWFPIYDNSKFELYSVFFIDAYNGYSCGFGIGYGGVVLKTSDGGNNWSIVRHGRNTYLLSVYFTSIDTGYVAGDNGTIMKTNTGGLTKFPNIINYSQHLINCYGASFSLGVVAEGASTLSYNWQYYDGITWNNVINGMPVGAQYYNSTTDSLIVFGITSFGSFQYRCIVSNNYGADTSNVMKLIINPDYTIFITDSISNGQHYTLPDNSVVSSPGVYTTILHTKDGCDSIIVTTISVIVSTDDILEQDEFFLLFPNPVNDIITIKSNYKGLMTILDLNGKVLKSKIIQEENEILDITAISAGVYLVQIKTDKRMLIKRLIKK